ncbi:MAG: hypothetical protein R3E32_04005 [Chitinophagales bacterium]
MNYIIKFTSAFLCIFLLNACTNYSSQNEASTQAAKREAISKTVIDQSPAYIGASSSMNKMKMQIDGTWQDSNNAKKMFVISGNEYYELYEGRQVSKMKFDIYNACPSAKGIVDENGHFIWLRTALDTICYEIADLNTNSLVLLNTEKGNKLQYERR